MKNATEVYRNALAREVRGLGYEIEPHRDFKGKDHGFEIRGVSTELVERYSVRSAQRDAAIEQFTVEPGRKPTDNEVAVLVRESREKLAEIATGRTQRTTSSPACSGRAAHAAATLRGVVGSESRHSSRADVGVEISSARIDLNSGAGDVDFEAMTKPEAWRKTQQISLMLLVIVRDAFCQSSGLMADSSPINHLPWVVCKSTKAELLVSQLRTKPVMEQRFRLGLELSKSTV